MLTFTDVQTFLTAGLTAKGYTDQQPLTNPSDRQMPLIDPGPGTIATLQKKTSGSLVFATVGNGAGLELEETYDQVFVTLRVIGLQDDYDYTERLALDLDGIMLALTGSGYLGSTRVLAVVRSGGRPQLIDYDSSSRYQFQATYVVRAATGL